MSPSDSRSVGAQMALFERLCDLSPEQAEVELKRACAGDAQLEQEVRALLAADRDPSSDLDGSPFEAAGALTGNWNAALGTARPPERIGKYEILGLLGQGGMGVVYEARQEAPQRKVALKLLRPGLLDDERLRRFEHEAQVLGRLNHPGIAQVLEAGTADTSAGGRRFATPFIAMELVRGQRIDRHAAQGGLGIGERLRLVARLCDAVQHAHDQGVVHRDLKPANVMVTPEGHLKVLDFGVARMVTPDVETLSRQTATGEVLGTLPYMSPEQVAGTGAEVDARSDVYAIGALAYELLSGQRPLDVHSRSLAEAARVITHDEPTSLGALDRRFLGDIEVMIGKAMAKEKALRYESAAALAADLRRFLADEPILARAPSRSYRIRKFARRHRELVGGVALAFVVLLGGAVTSTLLFLRSQGNLERAEKAEGEWHAAATESEDNLKRALEAEGEWKSAALEARENLERAQDAERAAREAAQRAELEATFAREVTDFVVGIFRVPDPSGVAGSKITALELLDRGRSDIASRLGDQPEVRAELMNAMGRVYFNLAQYETAKPLLDDTIATLRASANPEPLALAEALFSLGECYHYQGLLTAIPPLYEEALAIRRAHLEPGDPVLARSIDILGRLFRDLGGHANEALAQELTEEAYEMRLEAGVDDMELSESLQSLGFLAFQRGDLSAAEEDIEAALEIRRGLPEAAWRVPELLNTLATLRRQRGQYEEAEILGRECIEKCLERFGETHAFNAHAYRGLAATLNHQRRFEECAAMLEKALACLGEHDYATRDAVRIDLAFLRQDMGDLDGAEDAYLEALESYRERQGEDSLDVAIVRNDLASLRLDQGRPDAAEELERSALDYFRAQAPGHHVHAHCLRTMALALEAQGRTEEAVAFAREAVERSASFWGQGSEPHRGALQVLARVSASAGNADQAAGPR